VQRGCPAIFSLDSQVDFFPVDRQLEWCFDANSNSGPTAVQDCDDDIVTDSDTFFAFAGQYQHFPSPEKLGSLTVFIDQRDDN